MYPGEFETLFRKLANVFTLETIAERQRAPKGSLQRNPTTPLWDTMDDARGYEYIDIKNNRRVSCKYFLRKPIRILFFILLVEVEGRLFRIHEWRGRNVGELNEKNFNHLIKELVDSNLIKLQHEYQTRAKFNEDLKAISAFRNIIMHVNKKLEKNVQIELLIERKKQILKLLAALQQIMDRMGH